VSQHDIALVCKNAANLRVVRSNSLEDEYKSANSSDWSWVRLFFLELGASFSGCVFLLIFFPTCARSLPLCVSLMTDGHVLACVRSRTLLVQGSFACSRKLACSRAAATDSKRHTLTCVVRPRADIRHARGVPAPPLRASPGCRSLPVSLAILRSILRYLAQSCALALSRSRSLPLARCLTASHPLRMSGGGGGGAGGGGL